LNRIFPGEFAQNRAFGRGKHSAARAFTILALSHARRLSQSMVSLRGLGASRGEEKTGMKVRHTKSTLAPTLNVYQIRFEG
jgi:hypothetical protein